MSAFEWGAGDDMNTASNTARGGSVSGSSYNIGGLDLSGSGGISGDQIMILAALAGSVALYFLVTNKKLSISKMRPKK